MKRLIIIVEGQTELEFVNEILKPFLNLNGLNSVHYFTIKHTNGGLTKYQHLKRDLLNCVFQSNAVVSTLIDFYALPKDFPEYENAKVAYLEKSDRVEYLEKAIREDLEKEKGQEFPNLVPYIQLHEFEALAFSSDIWLSTLFTKTEIEYQNIKNIFDSHPNPELINDSQLTAPSKRLEKHIPGYNKVIHGILILKEIGIETVLEKCPRFSNWVETLIMKAKEK
ncbi:DUF4276 family protein [Leptospira sp. GIMC2001]|uniref:DUF4276 family protein n=1 Tax=Leptospira sp. GIMC2001 TaxID=1513297 RepID=UPI00234B81C2|nr:DUF4276 family protein [Leptospira sp. GIMC2001]WCL51475.1 DUF4276 family protein [Leptospira sp. GIMC2001]